jgi:prepilin-type processing-associated H-X9-DG protein
VNATVRLTKVASLLCPSDPNIANNNPAVGIGGISYAANAGQQRHFRDWNANGLSYVPGWDGAISRTRNAGSITDGMSKTACFGEWIKGLAAGNLDLRRDTDRLSVSYTGGGDPGSSRLNEGFGLDPTKGDQWWNASCNASSVTYWGYRGEYWTTGEAGRGTGLSFSLRPNGQSCLAGGDASDWPQAACSRHPGGVNIAFLDGSVQFITDSINFRVYWGYGSIAGNDNVQ